MGVRDHYPSEMPLVHEVFAQRFPPGRNIANGRSEFPVVENAEAGAGSARGVARRCGVSEGAARGEACVKQAGVKPGAVNRRCQPAGRARVGWCAAAGPPSNRTPRPAPRARGAAGPRAPSVPPPAKTPVPPRGPAPPPTSCPPPPAIRAQEAAKPERPQPARPDLAGQQRAQRPVRLAPGQAEQSAQDRLAAGWQTRPVDREHLGVDRGWRRERAPADPPDAAGAEAGSPAIVICRLDAGGEVVCERSTLPPNYGISSIDEAVVVVVAGHAGRHDGDNSIALKVPVGVGQAGVRRTR